MNLPDWLLLPETREISDLDSPAATVLHGEVIRRKTFLRELYHDFYSEMIGATSATHGGTHVELGSGGGVMKDLLPSLVTSDMLPLPTVDCCFDAEAMPFGDSSIDTFFMLNALHHFPNVERALREIERCLKAGGRVAMIEPANTAWGRLVYRNFHHEAFEPGADWTFESSGPLTGGNGALPYIVFVRDRETFESRFPSLQIERIRYHTPLRYLLSGGFTLRQLVPSMSHGAVRAAERATGFLGSLTGMFMTVAIRKASQA